MRSKRRRSARSWWLGLGVAALVLAGWLLIRTDRKPSPDIPGPIGGSRIALDVNTLVGQRSPTFSLPDAQGKIHAVVPGRGRPVVLILHMGFF